MESQISSADRPAVAKTPAEICRAVNADFKLQGLTHADAAKMLGVDRRSVSNQLSGKRPFAKKGALRYAKAFGYDETFLLFGTGELRGGRKQPSAVETLTSRYAGRMDSGLFQELHAVYAQLDSLQAKLKEAQEANLSMEQQILVKNEEIARLTSVKPTTPSLRGRVKATRMARYRKIS